MIAILIFLGKAFAYLIVSILVDFLYVLLMEKIDGDPTAFYDGGDAFALFVIFLILSNLVLWLIDPISHIMVSIVWR